MAELNDVYWNAASDPSGVELNSTTGWSNSGTSSVASDASIKYVGNYSIRITSGPPPAYSSFSTPIEAGKAYVVTFFVKRSGSGYGYVNGDSIGFTVGDTSWRTKSMNITPTGSSIVFTIYGAGGSVWIDGISIIERSEKMILNSYQMMQDVRDSLNEATASHWTDLAILRKLNRAQRQAAMMISMANGDWLMTKTNITPSDSLVALPEDCSKPVYLERTDDGTELPISITVRERQQTRITPASLDALGPDGYMYGEYIELNQESFTSGVTLWYERRVPDLHFGTASAGGSNTITFSSTMYPVRKNDYYNGSYIEVISGTGAGTRAAITDYTGSTGAAVVSGTFSTDSVYGTETVLPQEAIPVIVQSTVISLISKPSAAIDPKYFEYAKLELKDAIELYTDWISTRIKNSNRIRQQDAWL